MSSHLTHEDVHKRVEDNIRRYEIAKELLAALLSAGARSGTAAAVEESVYAANLLIKQLTEQERLK